MGIQFLDQYSLLHFSTGVIAYFFGFSLVKWIIIHIIFETLENTERGMRIINKYFKFWPGGKEFSDSKINQVGDILSGFVGWTVAYFLDNLGNELGWFPIHGTF